jgi:branched-chain amino acid transport system permease protein
LANTTTSLSRLADHPRVRSAFTIAGAAILFYAVLQVFWPAPIGVLVQGMIIGGLTSLIAFGIALIYRSNRIINFAQGDLGAAPAVLTVLLLVATKVPYVLALPIGILAAIALGTVVEFVIIRRFFKAPRLILTVATLGLLQILAGVAVLLPRFFRIRTPPQSFPSPFDFSFEIHPIIFRGNDILAMVAIPVAIVALVAFFRYTHTGIAVRASAESADRAFLLGVPVKRIQTVVWVLATVLSSIAIFLRAGIVGLPIGSVLGPSILLRALTACVIGRMENLTVIFVSAVGIGMVEQSIVWDTGRSIIIAPILFVIILGALLFQRRGQIARTEEGSTWQAAKEVRPIPRELARLPEVKWTIRVLLALGALALVMLPVIVPESRVNLSAAIMIFAIIGLSLVILTGWAGQVSLGQMAFVGVGAAVAGAVTTRLHWDLAFAVAIGGLAGALVAIVIGLPALRLKGLFLAVTTLSFALATSQYLLNREFFGWWLPEGRIPRNPIFGLIAVDTETRYYYLTLAGFLLAVYAARSLRRTHAGRALIAVRENERAAQAYGVSATGSKLAAFALSGFLAAYAGGLFIHHQQSLGTGPFASEESLNAFTMVVIGGLGSVPGALLGAIYVRGTTWFLPSGFRFFTGGVGLLVILMLIPGGFGSVLYQLRDGILRRVAARRRILVPSLVADARDADVVITSAREKGLEFLRTAGDAALAGEALALATDDGLPVEPEPLANGSRRRTSKSRTKAGT